jgi:purine-binding chemotaxis protein CheW
LIDSQSLPWFHAGILIPGRMIGKMSSAESQYETPEVEPANVREVRDEPQLHDVVPFVAGERIFAVFVDEVEGTAEAKAPAALPNAPPAVLGVVCVRGRMMTVLDPVALLTGEPFSWAPTLPYVIALRGEEQLALAAESCLDMITIAAADIQRPPPASEDGPGSATLGIARHGGKEITILSVDNLFSAVVRRKERRRRRF